MDRGEEMGGIMCMRDWRVRLLGLVLGVATVIAAAPATAQITAFRQAVAEIASEDRDLAAYYRQTDYAPLWTGQTEADRARREALLRSLSRAHLHGLPAGRYDLDGLISRMQQARTLRDLGQVEAMLSRSFLRYARDVHSGVLVPSKVDPDIKRDVPRPSATRLLDQMRQGNPAAVLRGLPPQSNEYARLLKEKIRLENVLANGGWAPTVQAQSLRPGATGPQVVALRDRLTDMGYMSRAATRQYDGPLQEAVQAFQADHGLEADGIAGASTIAALNVPVAERLKSVIVAMERERWLKERRGPRHVLVNLTDFSARLLDNDRVTFQTRAVIGKNTGNRRSPEFSDEMEHMVINPTWHVPRSIAVREYLPKMQRNRNAASYLKLYNSNGREVSRGAINFRAYNARTFPFAIKQPPSSRNALGLVKFMFPNKYNIYLHDTPQKALFDREKRDFSHGCIRLHQPFDFAYALLSAQEDDPKAYFHSVLDSGRETHVELETHVPVHIIYRTAFTQAKGRIQFRGDVYGRDGAIWDALDAAGVSLADVQG